MNVSITDDLLSVKGERRFDREVKDESYHRLERVYGKFERSLNTARFASTLAITTGSGVPILRALQTSAVNTFPGDGTKPFQ